MATTKFFTLGGMQEIGKTCMVVEHENEIVIIDAGIKFTNSMETGVEGIIPDYSYLKENEHKIKGLFITHGHEDHIGGIPYLIQQVNIPKIYAPNLAISYITHRLKDKKVKVPVEFEEITKELEVKFDDLSVDFWSSQHSIPDSFGIRVKTPNGNIFDTGDFRFDYTPIGNLTDFTKLEKMAEEGIDILISDSTNSMSPDHSPTEERILVDIEKFIQDSKGKTIFAAFASNLSRVKAVIDIAVKNKKRVAVFGRSMVNAIEIGKRLKWIDVPDNTFVDKRQLDSVPDKDLLILSTGSQGEEMAALSRMASASHPQVKIKHGDTILFSSSPIPGNRMKIEQLINKLYKVGATIKENKIDGMLHTSGHAYKEEHLKIFDIVKPGYFIPYHGAYRQSAVHGYTAVESGLDASKVILIDNGDVVELNNRVVTKTDKKVPFGPIYIDGKTATGETAGAIKAREELGENGFINVAIVVNSKKNEIVGRTRIISRGALFVKDSRELVNEVQRMAHGAALFTIKNSKGWTKADIKENVKKRLQPFFYQKKRRNPMIIVSIIEHAKPEHKAQPNQQNKKSNNNNKPNNNNRTKTNKKPENKPQAKQKTKQENKKN